MTSYFLVFILQVTLIYPIWASNVEPQWVKSPHEGKLVDQLRFSKYLKEVIQVLNGKEDFDSRIDHQLVHKLKEGDPDIQTKLDEVKNIELRRIKQLTEELQRHGLKLDEISGLLKEHTKHVDISASSFSQDDLRKLILHATAELAILDNQRRKNFIEYEMQKRLEFEELFKRLTPLEQAQTAQNQQQIMIEYRKRRPIHMPISKQHLLQVWHEKDLLEKESFNTKTFFHLHDLDGNGFMDEHEIKILLHTLIADLGNGLDTVEHQEELERMREHAFQTIDMNRDHLISLEEFLDSTKRSGYDDQLFWERLKSVPLFTEEDYKLYANANRADVNKLIDEGKILLPSSGFIEQRQV